MGKKKRKILDHPATGSRPERKLIYVGVAEAAGEHDQEADGGPLK
jgi:hypothetical protein